MSDKMKVKINENELRDMIAKSVNEAFSYDGDDAPMKYNILVSDRDLNEMLYNFPGLINRAAATRGGLNYVYADGKIEEDMGTDYFYVINPRIPDLHSLPTSFYGWYKGKKVIIGVWKPRGEDQYGHAVYADDKEALDSMKRLARGEE